MQRVRAAGDPRGFDVPRAINPESARARRIIACDAKKVLAECGMISIGNIHPVTDFKRKTAEFRDRLKATGEPEVLTIDGRPALVVQDAQAYQRLLDRVDQVETIQALRESMADAAAGRSRSFAAFDREFRKRYRLPKRA